jgi:DNA-binding NarL/FixJ family response regulator
MKRDGDVGVPVRVVIVGPRLDVRRALEIRIGLEPDLLVVGSLETVDAHAPPLRNLAPDVLLVDVDLRSCCGGADIARARAAVPGLPVVLLTLEVDGEARRRAAEWGRVKVVAKSAPTDRLVEVLRDRRQEFV